MRKRRYKASQFPISQPIDTIMSNTFCQELVLHYISQDRRHSRLSSLFGDTDSEGDFHLRPSTKGGSTFPREREKLIFFFSPSNRPAIIQSSSSQRCEKLLMSETWSRLFLLFKIEDFSVRINSDKYILFYSSILSTRILRSKDASFV